MTNITINYKNRTLELTKTFEKAARNYGSDEYNELKAARADFPTYKIVVRTGHKRNDPMNRITLERIEEYLKKVKGADSEELITFNRMRGINKDGELDITLVPKNHNEIKKWFIDNFVKKEDAEKNTEETSTEEAVAA